MSRIRFIVNPKSGINRNPGRIVRWIEEICSKNRIDFEVLYTGKPGDATNMAREAVEENFDIVAVVGGDGTVNEAGRGLLGSEVAMAVIPSGSGNGFARNFKIPLDQYKSIQTLVDPKIISIDAGKINNHHFFNVAGFGLDAQISMNFEEFGMRGPLPYFLVGTRSFLNFQPTPVKLILEENTVEFSPLVVTIANAPEYGNGAIIAPNAQPDDGLLDVTIIDHMPIWKAVPNLYRLFNGTIDQIEGFHTFRVKSVIIEREASAPIHTDGNPHQDSARLKIETVPLSLRVVTGSNGMHSEPDVLP
ncbi:MAG: diacylglycerol kinase family lipid kinase [Calditrichaeota bacterium]|nr:diacylglycerol kinase family lipid kinase [Calditrichota bacterium]RQW04483.1 MAG: diacylglycerol kinase family lipid kinase [Calditrichota bacterium]